jgi:uncharacterized protein (DUF1684 family)
VTYEPSAYLELYDFRLRVFAMYRERNESLIRGEDAASVCDRFRSQRDELFGGHSQSAYDEEQRRNFTGLGYFPYDPSARVNADVDIDVEPQQLAIQTSGEESMPMNRIARLRFTLAGAQMTLSLYWIDVYGGGLFLPFRDTTAPAETYGGGRYLFDTVKGSDFLSLPSDDGVQRISLDFNYAYNPSCAYNHRWSCPLAPPENHLPVSIRAGEKKPR